MTEWGNNDNPFIDPDTLYGGSFRPLPLPDDLLGFNDPSMAPPPNLQPPPAAEPLDQHQNGEDLESILFDLGISDAYQASQNASSDNVASSYAVSTNTGPSTASPVRGGISPEPTKSHGRKVSGSGIFGFVGSGLDTQLSIPGVASEPVPIDNKKPVYPDVVKFDNMEYSKGQGSAESADSSEPEYFFTGSGATGKFKFPPNAGDQANTSPITGSYSAQDLRALRHYHPNLEGYSSSSTKSSPIKRVSQSAMMGRLDSSPTKEFNSVEDIERVLNGKDVKAQQHLQLRKQRALIQGQFQRHHHSLGLSPSRPRPLLAPPTNLSVSSIMGSSESLAGSPILRSPESSPFKAESSPTKEPPAVVSLKVKNTFMDVKTPSPQKAPKTLNWIPTLITKKNNISEKILKEQARSPTRKKRPTIKSTLATGTLDKYFVGPDEDKLYTCKYKDCNKTFTRISNIRAHIQTHLCDRPFVCPVCKKAFVRNHDLRRHYKGHMEYQYVCPCGKKFPRQDALKRHRIRNICVGGIPDDKGILKKKKKRKSTTISPETAEVYVSKINQDQSRWPQKMALPYQNLPIEGSGPSQFTQIPPLQLQQGNYQVPPEGQQQQMQSMDQLTPKYMFEGDLDMQMDYSFNLEDIATS